MIRPAYSKNLKEVPIYQSLQKFPGQFLESWQIVSTMEIPTLPSRSPKVYYAGMGGSSLPADLINEQLKGFLQLQIIRDYQLPPEVQADDIVLCASFSGNTEETLAIYEEARARGCFVLTLSHGGELKRRSIDNGVSHIAIPPCIQPRCATGYFFSSTLAILHRLGLIVSPQESLEELSEYLFKYQKAHEQKGLEIAHAIGERIPIIYGPNSLAGVCRIWKIKFNENSKVQSFWNTFPEVNHNEMVGFTKLLCQPAIIYLKSQWMHPRVDHRMKVMKEVLSPTMTFIDLILKGPSPLAEAFEALAIGDYASYYLAKNHGVDPTPVEMVEDFKKRLSKP